MTRAEIVMQRLNPNGLIGTDHDGAICLIEDVIDPDGRIYRMEIRSTADGRRAAAYCRHNPWGAVNGGTSYAVGHVAEDGFLCLGSGISGHGHTESPFRLEVVIARSRYWTTAFSVLKETGTFPQP